MIKSSLTAAQVHEFYALEQQLRRLYLEFAERYAGGGMSGLLLQEERLAGGSFLTSGWRLRLHQYLHNRSL